MPVFSVFSVGELLAEFVAREKDGGHARAGIYEGPFPSGAPAIFVDQAALCGASTRMFGGVGADGFGTVIRERLAKHGVDMAGVIDVPGRATGVAFAAYNSDGSRDFVFHITDTAADGLMPPPADHLGASGVMHVSGSSLGNAKIAQIIMATVEIHCGAGGKLSVDPNVRKELYADPAVGAALRALVARADFLLPSEDDVAVLYPGLDDEAALDAMLSGTAEVVAIKRGDRGAVVANADMRVDLPGHRVDVVDPTGAGDCFCGTLIGLLAQGMALEEAAIRANAAGALAVTALGPMEGNAPLAAIEQFLSLSCEREVV